MIAVQKPALKIPPITSHELSVIAIARAKIHTEAKFFMSSFFYTYAKALPPLSYWWMDLINAEIFSP
jgi:hypothetical protein